MSIQTAIVLALAAALPLSACSAANPVTAPSVTSNVESTDKGGIRSETVTIHAAVESVDAKSRRVKLRGFDGTTQTIQVGEEVRNLPQLKKGDEVVATYYQSVAYEVLEPGQAKLGVEGVHGVGRTELGEKPGAVAATVVTVVADVLKLNRNDRTAVLKTDKGEVVTVHVQRPEVFDKVKVGQRVAIELTEAVAIDVQAAPK